MIQSHGWFAGTHAYMVSWRQADVLSWGYLRCRIGNGCFMRSLKAGKGLQLLLMEGDSVRMHAGCP